MDDDQRTGILLVDGDALQAMTLLLRRKGYQIVPSRSYDEAIQLAATSHCHLLITDISLDGRTGVDLMRDLKARYGLRGIAVSRHISGVQRNDPDLEGFDRVIAKPIDFDLLLAAIRELTESTAR